MGHQAGGGKNDRRDHDREDRSNERTTGNPNHLSKVLRVLDGVLVVLALIG